MKIIFLDTNVIIDFLADRLPFSINAAEETIKYLEELSEMTERIDVTKSIIKKSLKSEFKDFEDAIQYHCALTILKMDFIVTRNSKDFKKSTLPVMNPQEAIGIINIHRS